MRGCFCGVTAVDIFFFVENTCKANEKISANDVMYFAGGPATNASITFKALGGTSTLCSSIGDSPLLPVVISDLKMYQIQHLNISSLSPLSVSSIQIDSRGNRACTTSVSPSRALINPIIPPINFDNVDIFLSDGFYLDIFIHLFENKRVPLVLDGGSWKKGLDAILPYVDYAICSDVFCPPSCEKDPYSIYQFLKKIGVKNIAITRGELPIQAFVNDELVEIEVPLIQCLDSLGAGDIFHGAFCFYILQGFDFLNSLKKASEIASLSCKYKGPREWIKHL